MHNIAVIDDHKLFSSGLSLLFCELKQEIEVDTFVSIEEFIQNSSIVYSVIVLDFYLPGSDFMETMNFLSKADSPVVVVSASPSPSISAVTTSLVSSSLLR